MNIAAKTCGGKIAFTLEGGYNVEGEAKALIEIIHTLEGNIPFNRKEWIARENQDLKKITPTIERIKSIYGAYWPVLNP